GNTGTTGTTGTTNTPQRTPPPPAPHEAKNTHHHPNPSTPKQAQRVRAPAGKRGGGQEEAGQHRGQKQAPDDEGQRGSSRGNDYKAIEREPTPENPTCPHQGARKNPDPQQGRGAKTEEGLKNLH